MKRDQIDNSPDLSNQRANVDEEVVTHVDVGDGHDGVINDPLARLQSLDHGAGVIMLILHSKNGKQRSPNAVMCTITALESLELTCSAIIGEMLHLKKPTPMPKKIRPTTKQPRDPEGLVKTWGMAEMMMMMWPKVAIPMAMLMVLYFPQ